MASDAAREGGSTAPLDADRLNGWKEIASFLDRGVRTVQRWESSYGLPVRRIGKDGGEIIFASRREITAWLESEGSRRAVRQPPQTDPSPAPAPEASASAPHLISPAGQWRRRAYWLTGTGGVALALALASWFWLGQVEVPTRGAISHLAIDVQDFVAYDRDGRVAWRYRTALDLQEVARKWAPGESTADYAVVDADGDGSREVIVAGRSSSRRDGMAFFLLNEDGTLRRAISPQTKLRVGDTTFAGPWVPHNVFVALPEDRKARLFVSFIDTRLFPSLLLEVNAQGEVVSEYFSNGYVNSVVDLPWNGERVLAVGAANNEHNGGSLAIFKNRPATGGAPAEDVGYQCVSCPRDHPDAFLVFPSRCFNQTYDRSSLVDSIHLNAPGELALQVLEGDHNRYAGVTYVLGPNLNPLRAEVTSGLVEWHERWLREGRLDHPLSSERDGPDLFPVLAWSSGRFSQLPSAPIVW